MKAKLIKVITENEPLWNGYDDDYHHVTRHFAREVSEWEEIEPYDLQNLKYFLATENKRNYGQGYYYMLVTDDQPYTITLALKDIQLKAEKDRLAALEAEEKRKKEKMQRQKLTDEAKKARLLKQLANIPCYAESLDEMHEAEKVILENSETWSRYVAQLKVQSATYGIPTFHLTASQRAEAFLRTLNLWEE